MNELPAAMTVRGSRSRGSWGGFSRTGPTSRSGHISEGLFFSVQVWTDVERHYSHQVMAVAEHVVAIRGRA